MTFALTAALVAVIIANAWLNDRKDKRHDAHVNRLLHWAHRPDTAALEQVQETREGPAFTNEYRQEQDRLLKLVGDDS